MEDGAEETGMKGLSVRPCILTFILKAEKVMQSVKLKGDAVRPEHV